MIKMPNMIMIGAAGKNIGKTTLASQIINNFKDNYGIIAIKITIIRDDGAFFDGRNAVRVENLKNGYMITGETDFKSTKDTSRLLRAGAKKVYWLRTIKSHIWDGFNDIMRKIPDDAPIVCESNTLRNHVEPGVFVIVRSSNLNAIKPSAQKVWKYADKIIYFDSDEFDFEIDEILFKNGKWIAKPDFS